MLNLNAIAHDRRQSRRKIAAQRHVRECIPAAAARMSNRLAISGMGFLALATAGVVYLISDVLYHEAVASAVTAVIAGCFVWFWYGLPLSRRTLPDRG